MSMKKRRNAESQRGANFLAKRLAVYAFRNGPVEDMHANGQLSDEDMKTLNKYMVDRLAEYFYLCNQGRFKDIGSLLCFPALCCEEWDDANIDDLEKNVKEGKDFYSFFTGNI